MHLHTYTIFDYKCFVHFNKKQLQTEKYKNCKKCAVIKMFPFVLLFFYTVCILNLLSFMTLTISVCYKLQ